MPHRGVSYAAIVIAIGKNFGVGILASFQYQITIASHSVPLWLAVFLPSEVIVWGTILILSHFNKRAVCRATRDTVYQEVYDIATHCR